MAQPNIIVVIASQHRWDCSGYAGNPDLQTPNLDALARHGCHFSQAVCPVPASIPSRTSVLAGQYPVTSEPASTVARPTTRDTLPGVLQRQGYVTAAIGKPFANPDQFAGEFQSLCTADNYRPEQRGNEYHDWLRERGITDQVGRWDRLPRNEAPAVYWDTFGAMVSTLSPGMHATAWIGNQAVRFIQSAKAPFFLCIAFTKPQHPYDPPAPWHRMYDPAQITLPPGFRLPHLTEDRPDAMRFDLTKLTERAFRRVLAHYYASISFLDSQIGRILATLSARGHTNNVIVYTADYGEYMGQHGLLFNNGARPYESLIRVPLIVSGVPGQHIGQQSDALVEHVDLMPTLLDAVGVPIPSVTAGQSMLPILLGETTAHRHAQHVAYHGETHVVRTHAYKLIESPDADRRAFYDLKNDPEEFQNCYGDTACVDAQAELTEVLAKSPPREHAV